MVQEAQELQPSGPAERVERYASGKKRAWAKWFRVSAAPIRWLGIGRGLGLALLALFVALRSWDPAPVDTTCPTFAW